MQGAMDGTDTTHLNPNVGGNDSLAVVNKQGQSVPLEQVRR